MAFALPHRPVTVEWMASRTSALRASGRLTVRVAMPWPSTSKRRTLITVGMVGQLMGVSGSAGCNQVSNQAKENADAEEGVSDGVEERNNRIGFP